MELPVSPPEYATLARSLESKRLADIFPATQTINDDRYLHWGKLRHKTPPDGWTHEEWWLAIKVKRNQSARIVENFFGVNGQPFCYSLPDSALEAVHDIDSRARGSIALSEQVTAPGDRNRYNQPNTNLTISRIQT